MFFLFIFHCLIEIVLLKCKKKVVIDEVGRGTATDEGRAIARAALEHLINSLGSRTLFATHFRELAGNLQTPLCCWLYFLVEAKRSSHIEHVLDLESDRLDLLCMRATELEDALIFEHSVQVRI